QGSCVTVLLAPGAPRGRLSTEITTSTVPVAAGSRHVVRACRSGWTARGAGRRRRHARRDRQLVVEEHARRAAEGATAADLRAPQLNARRNCNCRSSAAAAAGLRATAAMNEAAIQAP